MTNRIESFDSDRRHVPGFSSRYTVDRNGNVFSNGRKLDCYVDRSGYLQAHITTIDGISRVVPVHRLVALAWVSGYDPDRDRVCVDHIDGNKLNNCADNLRWVTRAENSYLAYQQGLMAAHLTPVRVIALNTRTLETRVYPSLRQAVRDTGADLRHAHAILRGYDETRHSTNGWTFIAA